MLNPVYFLFLFANILYFIASRQALFSEQLSATILHFWTSPNDPKKRKRKNLALGLLPAIISFLYSLGKNDYDQTHNAKKLQWITNHFNAKKRLLGIWSPNWISPKGVKKLYIIQANFENYACDSQKPNCKKEFYCEYA